MSTPAYRVLSDSHAMAILDILEDSVDAARRERRRLSLLHQTPALETLEELQAEIENVLKDSTGNVAPKEEC